MTEINVKQVTEDEIEPHRSKLYVLSEEALAQVEGWKSSFEPTDRPESKPTSSSE